MSTIADASLPTSKDEVYARVLQEASHLIRGVDDLIANLANVAALLKQRFNFFWVGFYFLRGNRLVLGPFQGSPACVYLERPRGVCWAAVLRNGPIVVPDVHAFPGHIACNPASQSEVVVPLADRKQRIRGVLDIDSDHLAAFDDEDAHWLTQLAQLLVPLWK